MFIKFHFNEPLNSALKDNFICLIKEEITLTVKDFRPINLTSSLYKIVAEVLAELLKNVMPTIISPV